LGADICDSLLLLLPEETCLDTALAQRLYSPALEQGKGIRPMHVQKW
jgi:hypothetical protein